MVTNFPSADLIHTLVTLVAIGAYGYAIFTGLKFLKQKNLDTRLEVLAVIGSTMTSLCFGMLLFVWVINKSSSAMDWVLAISFELTHVISSLSIAAMHLLMMRW